MRNSLLLGLLLQLGVHLSCCHGGRLALACDGVHPERVLVGGFLAGGSIELCHTDHHLVMETESLHETLELRCCDLFVQHHHQDPVQGVSVMTAWLPLFNYTFK